MDVCLVVDQDPAMTPPANILIVGGAIAGLRPTDSANRESIRRQPTSTMTRIIAVANQKEGVAMTGYLLDNVAPQAGGRFAGLEACYDQSTFGYLSALGLGEGWRCWEIGAGGGSVVRWMAARVGQSGAVLGTGLNLDPLLGLRSHPRPTCAPALARS
jgi:hypothetical protein